MTFDHSRRLLFGAFALSLLLHLLAVFGWGWPRALPAAASALPRPAMQAVVSARSVLPPGIPEKPEPARVAAPVATSPPLKSPAALVSQGVPVRPLPAATTAAPSEATPLAAAVPALPAASSPAISASPAEPASAVVVSAESVSADGLRQYRIDLAVAARRFRTYPAVARARGWEGVAEVSIAVSAGGVTPSLRLVRSSGHAVLDDQALQMLGRALEGTPLPENLRGRSFVLAMPVRFSLEE